MFSLDADLICLTRRDVSITAGCCNHIYPTNLPRWIFRGISCLQDLFCENWRLQFGGSRCCTSKTFYAGWCWGEMKFWVLIEKRCSYININNCKNIYLPYPWIWFLSKEWEISRIFTSLSVRYQDIYFEAEEYFLSYLYRCMPRRGFISIGRYCLV